MSARYGISALSTEQFLSLPAKLPKAFTAVEFPGDVLESSSGMQKLASFKKNGITLCGRDFIVPEWAALIPAENCKLRAELEQHVQVLCAKAADAGVKLLAITFDLFQAVNDSEYKEKLICFLRRCAGVIHSLDQTLLLVCRVPGGGAFDGWEEILAFRRELLAPNIEFMIELHPHEPNAPEIISQALHTFRLHDTFRRICYDSSVGNSLTPGALKRCSETCAKDLDPEIIIFFNPGSGKFDTSQLAELDTLAQPFIAEKSER